MRHYNQRDSDDLQLAELHHRMRNNLQLLASTIGFRLAKTSDPSRRDELAWAAGLVQSMAALNSGRADTAAGEENLHAGLVGLCDSWKPFLESRSIRLEISSRVSDLDHETNYTLLVIAHELLTNCVKHGLSGLDGGVITIELQALGGDLELRVADNGRGIGKDGANIASGSSFVRQLCSKIGASFSSFSMNDIAGTVVAVRIPNTVREPRDRHQSISEPA